MTPSDSPHAHGNSSVTTLLVTMAVKPEHEQDFHTSLWIERYDDQTALQVHSEKPYIGEAMATVQDSQWWARPPELLQLSQFVPA